MAYVRAQGSLLRSLDTSLSKLPTHTRVFARSISTDAVESSESSETVTASNDSQASTNATKAPRTRSHGSRTWERTPYRGIFTRPEQPRHLTSIADLTHRELHKLVNAARMYQKYVKSAPFTLPKVRYRPTTGNTFNREASQYLSGKTVAMMFNKRSTRTRVSTEAAVQAMGGHPMFLGKDDIQLGVNESIRDTATIISSMTSCLVARVGPHSDITELAKYSSVPIINALSDDFHPLQAIADFLTIRTVFDAHGLEDLAGRKIAWVGDANNVLFDMAMASIKSGVEIAVATPEGYGVPEHMMKLIQDQAQGVGKAGKITTTNVPEEAVKDADIIVTDTWISMGQEEETAKRLKAFEGFQVTMDLAKRGGAKDDWKFMHCLPRHKEEVDDEVFYSDRSLVFPEGENRLYAALAALDAFVVHNGIIV